MSAPRTDEIAAIVCAREPIHLVGAIQPEGWLLVADERTLAVTHVSANMAELFGVGAEAMLDAPLADFLEAGLVSTCLEQAHACLDLRSAQHVGQYNIGDMAWLCDVSTHCGDGLLQIEIELAPAARQARNFTASAHAAALRTAGKPDLVSFAREMVAQLRELTGFDRVMAYRFLPDATGEVMAEAVTEGMEPWLGQRYPASDIPAQARALYLKNRIRVIPDTRYVPVALYTARERAGMPLDMSFNVLRSISPVHLQYLRNMEVGASMSISVVFDGRLWGMILFQHREPRRVSAEARNALDLLGAFFSVRVAAHLQAEQGAWARRTEGICAVLRDQIGSAADHDAAIERELPLMARLVESDGIAMYRAGRWRDDAGLLDADERASLESWLAVQDGWVAAVSRGEWREGAGVEAPVVAGVLAVRMAASGDDWLLFLRRPYDREIRWAGIPDKHVEQIADGGLRIAPRADFSVWRELRRGACEDWGEQELSAAHQLVSLLDTLRR
ncbi:GAF domain-containing protein [Solilutibacter pythonis]|nr:GAF domain-containing protein [Lysobacter pythonis]